MPYIRIELTPPKLFDAINVRVAQAPALFETMQKRSMTRLGQRAMAVLRVEPPQGRTAGITRLMTPRQRRAFWATNGFGGGIPHVRTHGISQGWKYTVNAGEFAIFNDNPAVGYVEGAQQQPFLAAIGWLYAPPILEAFTTEAEAITMSNFQTAFDPFAGVP
jgi:hypothetical protein